MPLLIPTSILFQEKIVPVLRGEENKRRKSLERKKMFNVDINADKTSMEKRDKKTISKIFSQMNNLKKRGNSSSW
jgi:hypothetical protein